MRLQSNIDDNDDVTSLSSVVTDSEFASKSANFSPVLPNPNPRIFGGRKRRFWNISSINLYNLISRIYTTETIYYKFQQGSESADFFTNLPESVHLQDFEICNNTVWDVIAVKMTWTEQRSSVLMAESNELSAETVGCHGTL